MIEAHQNTARNYVTFKRKNRRVCRSHRVFDRRVLVTLLSLLSFGAFLVNPYDYGLTTRLLALSAFWLGAFPLVKWFYSAEGKSIPIFEGYMLFNGITFGFAGFMAQRSTLTARRPVTPEQWDTALFVVCLSLIFSAFGYYFFRSLGPKVKTIRLLPFELKVSGLTTMVGVLLMMLLIGYTIKGFVPGVLSQILQSFLLFSNIILLVSAFRKQVNSKMRFFILFVLTPANAFVFSTFAGAAIYGLFASLIPVAIVYYQSREKAPWLLIGSLVAVFIVLQPIKGEYRMQAWSSGTASTTGFAKFAIDKLVEFESSDESITKWLENSFRRLNHLHVTAAVIADTPASVPFLKGQTYTSLLFKLIPRVIWPDKPKDNLGNIWAHWYGYLYKHDFQTSFNLPFLTEMYMNFGYVGIVGISLLLGVLMGWLSIRYWVPSNSILITAFGVLIGLPFLTPESNLSLMAGRAIIGAITAYASLFALSVFFPKFVVRSTTSLNH